MSRTTVVALAAVAATSIALGFGAAYAFGGRSVKPQKHTLWAVVNSDGTFARHSKDIIGVQYVTAGQYRVLAKGDVRNCAYLVTTGDDARGIPPRTYGDAAQHLFDVRGVFVETYNADAVRTDSDFYLAILC